MRWQRLWADKAGLGYLLRWQVERADVVLVTKSDAVAPEQLAAIAAEMRTVRPELEPVPIILHQPEAGARIIAAVEEALIC